MKEIDRDALNTVQERVTQLLDPLGKELGLKIALGTGSFTSGNATFKLNVSLLGEGGVAETKERVAFRERASLFGLKATDLGRTFRKGRHVFTISGMKPRTTYPILATRGDGKVCKFGIETVYGLLTVAEVIVPPFSLPTSP